MDTILKTAADAMSTKDVVLWCRKYHYTPNKSDKADEEASIESTQGKEEEGEKQISASYCKFCGGKRNRPQDTTDDQCPRKPKDWNSRKRNAGVNSTTSVNKLLNKLEKGWDEVKESVDEMDIEVDQDETLPVTSTEEKNKIDDLLQRVKDFTFQDNMDVANERSIDWIWSVVGQLRLKSVIANDMLLAKDGNLQGPTSNFDLDAAMGQRLMVGNILHQVSYKLFI
ncbi:hypothetical protein K501DRAFT_188527 [Backusella circina FSU 941]|nr:hypothetical protein K501DRAFT_188527 [Backusella circina FSU 941]